MAFQIGVIVAIQRNRWRKTQEQVAHEVGTDQIEISNVENGRATAMTDTKIDKLFEAVDLDGGGPHANFVKWWRDNSTL